MLSRRAHAPARTAGVLGVGLLCLLFSTSASAQLIGWAPFAVLWRGPVRRLVLYRLRTLAREPASCSRRGAGPPSA